VFIGRADHRRHPDPRKALASRICRYAAVGGFVVTRLGES